MASIRCYSELVLIPTFEERFQYLRLDGIVGQIGRASCRERV